MYRLNFYPQYMENRRLKKRRLIQISIMSVVVGLEVTLVIGLALSAQLLGEQASRLRAEQKAMKGMIQQQSVPRPELVEGRALLEGRASRLDWTPKLAAVSQWIDPTMVLTELMGHAARGASPGSLRLTGSFRAPGDRMGAVTHFMDQLGKDRRLTHDFPLIKLEGLRESESYFQVTCADTTRIE